VLRQAVTGLDVRARAERAGELSLVQVSVLGRLVTAGPLTAGELAGQLRMLPQSLTRPLARLETAGLVQRTGDPSDGRIALLEATPDGRAAIRREFAPRTRWLAQAMSAVCDDHERAVLAEAAAIMTRLAEHGGPLVPVEP
jgi:DNA-binding MarR family transcriptional regulator